MIKDQLEQFEKDNENLKKTINKKNGKIFILERKIKGLEKDLKN